MEGQGHLDRPVQEEREPRHDRQAQEIAWSQEAEARGMPRCLIGCRARFWRGRDARRHDAEDHERCRIQGQMPAASGPMIVATDSSALASELAASRPSAPPTSASSEYSPALPQVPRSDDAASRSTYVDGLSAWASDRVAIAARLPDRRKQCARTRTVGDRRRRNLPSVMPPMTAGSVYAATARPT